MTAITGTPNGHAALEPGKTPDVVFAEKSVIGSIIASRRVAEAVIEILPAEDCFADAGHRAVYAAVRHLTEAGEPVEVPSVLARLVAVEAGVWRTGQAGIILTDLLRHASPSYETYARTVLLAATRRRGLHALEQAGQILADPAFDPEAGGDLVRKLVDDALTTAPAGSDPINVADLFTAAIDRIEECRPPGVIQSPWARPPRTHPVPATRPARHDRRTTKPRQVAPSAGPRPATPDCTNSIPVILFTMEMDRDEVMDRLLAAESGVLLKNIIDGTLDEAELDPGRQPPLSGSPGAGSSSTTHRRSPSPTSAPGCAAWPAAARRQVAIVDYLQLMAAPAGENRQREVSDHRLRAESDRPRVPHPGGDAVPAQPRAGIPA